MRRRRALHVRLILRRIDLQEELALPSPCRLPSPRADEPAHIRGDIDLGVRLHLSARGDVGDEIPLLHLLEADLDRLVSALAGTERDDGASPASGTTPIAIFDFFPMVVSNP